MNQYPDDPYHLERFVEAQDSVYDQVCWELQQGLKITHWMWFIFPQLEGLSSSSTSRKFAISSLEEAVAYLEHPILGTRLPECTELVNATPGRSIKRILGLTDSLKFQSCMTLFAKAANDSKIFEDALQKFYEGEQDQLTLEYLSD
jgi:uncharacterized protein (DUF1810 family)